MVSLSVSAQTAVPTWVRARAIATQMLVFQGCMALGSLLWGAIAQRAGISTALTAAGIGLIVCVLLTTRYRLRCVEKFDFAASLHWNQPTRAFEPCPNDGPVLVTLIKKALKESPSLKSYLESIFAECYTEAVKQAKAETGLPLETFPVQYPYELAKVIDDEFLPELKIHDGV